MARLTKRKFPNVSRYANLALAAYKGYHNVRQAMYNRRSNGSTGSRTAQQFRSPAPITGENDWRTTYKRKRMPRRKRKNWVRFSRKVQHVVQKQVAPQYHVFLRQAVIITAAGAQGFANVHTVMGANGGSGDRGTNDINLMINKALNLADTIGIVPTIKNLRIHVTGWMIETQIANTGSTTAYIDCYYWKAKRDVPSTIQDFGDLWAESMADVAPNLAGAGVGASALSFNDYGVTPFQGAQLAKSVRIWKKTRVKVAPGGTLQLEQRSGKNYYRVWSFDEHYSLIRNVTEGIFFIQYGTPTGIASTATAIAQGTTVNYSTNVNYTYKIIQDNRMAGSHADQT